MVRLSIRGKERCCHDVCEDGIAAQKIIFEAEQGNIYTLEKLIATITSRDTDRELDECIAEYLCAYQDSSYQKEYEKHRRVYQELFAKLEIQIEGSRL